jgi:hypothetical protein
VPFALRVIALTAGFLTLFTPAFGESARRLDSAREVAPAVAAPLAETSAREIAEYHGAAGVWRIAEWTVDMAADDPSLRETLGGAGGQIKRDLFEQTWALVGGAGQRPSAVRDFAPLASYLRAAMTRERVRTPAQDALLDELIANRMAR